jgi:hypothetical protein
MVNMHGLLISLIIHNAYNKWLKGKRTTWHEFQVFRILQTSKLIKAMVNGSFPLA